jgi:hypothetical protein
MDDIKQWQDQQRVLRSSCGCKSGMAALLGSLTLCIYHFGYAGGVTSSRQHKMVTTLLICLGAAIVGKVLGLLWAAYRHNVLKRKLAKAGSFA